MLLDQDAEDSIIETRRVYRGTDRYDPFSTLTSLTRKTTSTETSDENLDEASTSIRLRNPKSLQRPHSRGEYAASSNRRETVTNSLTPRNRRPIAESSSKDSREKSRGVLKSTTNRATTRTTPIPRTTKSGNRFKPATGTVPSTTPTIGLTTMSRGYSRVRVQKGTGSATTNRRESESPDESIEEENYPEHFKALLKEKFKTKSRSKDDPTKPTKSYKRTTRQTSSLGTSITTRLPKGGASTSRSQLARPTRKSVPVSGSSSGTEPIKKSEDNKKNNNLRVLFPTRKSSTRSVTTKTEATSFANDVEPTIVPIRDLGLSAGYSNADLDKPTKPSFLSKSKFRKSPKQLSLPLKTEPVSVSTVSNLKNIFRSQKLRIMTKEAWSLK